ncbi:uncharacterized protein LOC112127603 [Cimex lectularius]|uniref:RNase H type-1 domain-containing protein n=1 Tax=Cimex lectularius TaxID=79782 RepID=A0A8I6SP00_CIMLE|nr:uncharacterized protein LOC112127603 [Cimex lectularius]
MQVTFFGQFSIWEVEENVFPYNLWTDECKFTSNEISAQTIGTYSNGKPIHYTNAGPGDIAFSGTIETPCIQVIFVWIPGHCGIMGNEQADNAAKRATIDGIPLKAVRDNKLRDIKPNVVPWGSSVGDSRLEETVLTRLRIWHSRLTHGYLMCREPAPVCDCCRELVTVKHLMTNCLNFEQQKIFHNFPSQLTEILDDDPPVIN